MTRSHQSFGLTRRSLTVGAATSVLAALVLANVASPAFAAPLDEITVGGVTFTEQIVGETPTAVVTYYDDSMGEGAAIVIPSTVVIDDTTMNVVEIGDSAFENSSLGSISLPNTIEAIGANAFNNDNLSTVTIPDSVVDIAAGAFEDNPLETVTIGTGVKSIGAYAFDTETPDTQVTMLGAAPSTDVQSFSSTTMITYPASQDLAVVDGGYTHPTWATVQSRSLGTVIFDVNGGQGEIPEVTAYLGSVVTAPSEPVRIGFAFAGWSTAATDGSLWDFPSSLLTRSTTLFAQWTEKVETSTAPSAVSIPTLSAVTATGFTATWAAPTSDGGSAVLGYAVYLTNHNGQLVSRLTTAAGTLSATFTDLDSATLYAVTVSATNSIGTSDGSPSATVITLPNSPESLLSPETPNAIALDHTDVTQGSSVTISGLIAGESYYAWFLSDAIGTSWQTASGAGTITVTVPSTLTGTHRLVVTAVGGGIAGWSSITISGAADPVVPAAVVPAGSAPTVLANTGTDPMPLALGGLLLLTLGGLGFGIARLASIARRRTS